MSGHSVKIRLDRSRNHQSGERLGGWRGLLSLTRGVVVDFSEKNRLNRRGKELHEPTSVSRQIWLKGGAQLSKLQDAGKVGREFKSVDSVREEGSRGGMPFSGANAHFLKGEGLAQAEAASRILRKRGVSRDGRMKEVDVSCGKAKRHHPLRRETELLRADL
jgi:hypothetical protein